MVRSFSKHFKHIFCFRANNPSKDENLGDVPMVTEFMQVQSSKPRDVPHSNTT